MRSLQCLWSCMILLPGVVPSTFAEPSSFRADISQGWKLRVGDDTSWSDPAFDDSDWQGVRPGARWLKNYVAPAAREKHLHNHKDYQFYDESLECLTSGR